MERSCLKRVIRGQAMSPTPFTWKPVFLTMCRLLAIPTSLPVPQEPDLMKTIINDGHAGSLFSCIRKRYPLRTGYDPHANGYLYMNSIFQKKISGGRPDFFCPPGTLFLR